MSAVEAWLSVMAVINGFAVKPQRYIAAIMQKDKKKIILKISLHNGCYFEKYMIFQKKNAVEKFHSAMYRQAMDLYNGFYSRA